MSKVIIIAEIGENHIGDMNIAKQLINKAAESGVDYVKFQSYKPEIFRSDDPEYDWFKKVSLSDESHFMLKEYSEKRGIKFLSAPFSLERARFLKEKVHLNEVKVASGMMMDFKLLDYCNENFSTVFLSTGLATYQEIEDAVSHLEKANLYILHCVTQYPLKKEDANLSSILRLKQLFPDKRIGYSDHTAGILACLVAVSLGAEVVEKHFTLDKNTSEGTDHILSAEPEELKKMVGMVRDVEVMLGDNSQKPAECEKEIIEFVRRRFKK